MGRNLLCRTSASLIVAFLLGCRSHGSQTYHADPFVQSRPSQSGANASVGSARGPSDNRLADTPVTADAALPVFEGHRADSSHATAAAYEGRGAGRDSVSAAEHRAPPARAARTSDLPMDHAPDYSWLQGQLEYSALGGGLWKVRYAPVTEDDEHGGSVILDAAPPQDTAQHGDTVYVQGQIVAANGRGALRNPLYHVQRMVRVDDAVPPNYAGSRNAN